MVPEQVSKALYEQLYPLIIELAKYAVPGETIKMNFEVGNVLINF